ncbi:hypothetical protein AAG906_038913 [Vitis piasezkii]
MIDHNHHHHGDVPMLDLPCLKALAALGRGAKGAVFLVEAEAGEERLALKAVSRKLVESKSKDNDKNGSNNDKESDYRRICFEQEALRRFRHPLLPRLHGIVCTDRIVGYAIDYCPGRDLNQLRKKQSEKMFSDDIIRFYAAELVLALEYLHGLGIVYRDLKPENVLIQENGHLMLVDFDLSTKLSPKSPENPPPILKKPAQKPAKKTRLSSFHRLCNSGISSEKSDPALESERNSVRTESDSSAKSNSFVGTEEYVAPEIILGSGHDFAVDWWSLGVMLYEMLYGTTPFKGSNRKETFYRILAKAPELVGEATPLRDLIAKLLEKDPKQRIILEDIKGHDFFRGIEWDMVVEIGRPPYIPENEHVEGGFQDLDIESLVQEAFKIGDGDDNKKNSNNNNNNNNKEGSEKKGAWVEGLNHKSEINDFLIF